MALFEAHHLKTTYHQGGEEFVPFDDVDLELEAGHVYDLVGPSGSGKTTLLRVCARLLPLAEGSTLTLDGEDGRSIPPVRWRRRVCLVPQQPSLVDGTVEENLLLPWTLKVNGDAKAPDRHAMRAMLDEVLLDDVSLDQDAAQLSGGQGARVALVRAFLTSPTVYLLDEVDAALDSESAKAVGALAARLTDDHSTCLRIRHRDPDGFAQKRYRLDHGVATLEDAEEAAL